VQSGSTDRASVPFALSLAGLLVSAVAALIVGVAGFGMFGSFGYGSMMGGMMGGYGGAGMMNGYSPWGMGGWGAFTWMWIPLIIASIAIAAVGVFMIYSSRVGDVRVGSVLALVAAVIAFPTAFGFVIGSLLLALGGILGLIWSPIRQIR
jgi:hypothetical protein